ncbi:MAG: AmmeMemoRadiSam system radical SAM enzyme [Planctomycetes bacterium]|nr:AmmeMemoRadiSam system radical SAM enzyme [Planctomycetota bacterium]
MNRAGAALAARLSSALPDGRLQCELCPRHCRLRDGQRGFCFVRRRHGTTIELTTWGRVTGLCIDPIEKKPLHHFLPGTPVLSFGTAGCNLGCRFCQNWTTSRSRDVVAASIDATPEVIARTADHHRCRAVAFTYNDPVVFAEFAVDTAVECRALGLATVMVTAGYVDPGARADLFAAVDAANVDLKAFRDTFYRNQCLSGRGGLADVLDTIAWLVHDTPVWVELTTLLIPGHNDDDDAIREQCEWIAATLGPEVPLHFTAFHPDFAMRDVPATPPVTLRRARDLALERGLHHVYVGNVHDPAAQCTRCSGCGAVLIERHGYAIAGWRLDTAGRCAACGTPLPGRFDADPGSWGNRRVPVAPEP